MTYVCSDLHGRYDRWVALPEKIDLRQDDTLFVLGDVIDRGPDGHIKQRIENALERVDWRVDYVLSHTVPLSAIPRHAFLPTLDQSMVDNFTEKWMENIQRELTYERWFAGHFHVAWSLDRIQILFEDYDVLAC